MQSTTNSMKLHMFSPIRHSGAPRSGEPGIYNHRPGLMDSFLGLRPRPGMTPR
jgi:hypothetical protein